MWAASGVDWPMPVRIALAMALVLPLAPLLDRIVFRPVADGSVLLLMIVSVALHFALAGVGLLFFGPEGVRTRAADRGRRWSSATSRCRGRRR